MSIILGVYVFISDGISYTISPPSFQCYTPSQFLILQQGFINGFCSFLFAVALFFQQKEKVLGLIFLHILSVFVPIRLFATLLGLHYFGLNSTADSIILAMTSIGIGGFQIYLMYQLYRVIVGRWYDTSEFALLQRLDICFTEVLLALWLLIIDGVNYSINLNTQKKNG